MIVCRRFQPLPSIDKPPYMAMPIIPLPPLFLIIFPIPPFLERFFDNIAPMKYRINKKLNSWGKFISLFLED